MLLPCGRALLSYREKCPGRGKSRCCRVKFWREASCGLEFWSPCLLTFIPLCLWSHRRLSAKWEGRNKISTLPGTVGRTQSLSESGLGGSLPDSRLAWQSDALVCRADLIPQWGRLILSDLIFKGPHYILVYFQFQNPYVLKPLWILAWSCKTLHRTWLNS